MDITNDFDWAGILGKTAIAVVILIVTWLVAKAVKWAVAKLVSKVELLQRHGADGRGIGDSIGQIAALLVWLFGLIAVLQVFGLEQVLSPIQGLLATIMGFLPSLIGAGLVFFVGFLIAKIVKQLVETALGTVDFAGLMGRARSAATSATGTGPDTRAPGAGTGTAPTTAQAPPAASADDGGDQRDHETNARIVSVVGSTLFGIIILFVTIAALQVLGIESISRPAEEMLNTILDAVPQVVAALILLAIGYFVARFVADLLEGVLRGVGTDSALERVGVSTGRTSPSAIVATVVKIAILLFFAIMATQLLGFPALTDLLNQVLEIAGGIVLGGAIIAAGFFVASIIRNVMGDTTAGKIVRYATIVLFAAIGLEAMGLADSIVRLAFGSVVVGAALAAALAFGLGGRDTAARTLSRLESKAEESSPPPGNRPTV